MAWSLWHNGDDAARPRQVTNEEGPLARAFRTLPNNRLAQIAAKALDALAGVLEVRRLGRIGDAEGRSQAEGRSLHHRDALGFQQFRDKILVIGEHLARRRGLADGAGAGRIDIEGAFRAR